MMAVFENFPYTNYHELNLDWVIAKVKEYIVKTDNFEDLVNKTMEEQNAIIAKAVEDLANGMEELRTYIMENLQTIAQQIINELIETGGLYIGVNYIAETEELNIVLSQGE